jgi:phosphate-selective porin OprO/OprP
MAVPLRVGRALRGALVFACSLPALAAAEEPAAQPPATGITSALGNVVSTPQRPAAPPPPALTTEAEARLKALEVQNLKLAAQLEELRRQVSPPTPSVAVPGSGPLGAGTEREATGGPMGGLGGPLPGVPGGDEEAGNRVKLDLSRGIRLSTADGRYRIEFHDLTQFDARLFGITGTRQGDLHDNFVIPRQRLYFTGQVDEWLDFYSVLNRGYGDLDILDSYVNFKFDPAFNVRFGRTKVPYSYEYYKIAEGDLIAPERSVFIGNLSPNRQLGVLGFGRLLNERLEYAVGLFCGPHRSFQDFNNFKNPFFYLNARPFLLGGSDLLRNLNFGASFNFGREDDPLEPNALRTANDETTTPNATNVSPTFLQFNDGVVERGATAFWSGDIAWYYRSLTMLSMYNGGYITYARGGAGSVRVPFEGGSVALTYFLTGEEIVRRKDVEPLRNFNWRSPWQHPGAVEAYSRVAYLNAGQTIFTGGLADASQYSRNALVLDNGINWYLNRFIRICFDWQHSEFGRPVNFGNHFSRSMDMFWFRTQLFY